MSSSSLIAGSQVTGGRRRVLIGATGSVAAIRIPDLVNLLISENLEVQIVATKAALYFLEKEARLPANMVVWKDEDEWETWKCLGDDVLHIQLRRWADILVVAPLSANSLAKYALGLCDNLLTSILRAWDYSRPVLVAPAMNTFMWENSPTNEHMQTIIARGVRVIGPVEKRLACGDIGSGAMASAASIAEIIVEMTQAAQD